MTVTTRTSKSSAIASRTDLSPVERRSFVDGKPKKKRLAVQQMVHEHDLSTMNNAPIKKARTMAHVFQPPAHWELLWNRLVAYRKTLIAPVVVPLPFQGGFAFI